MTEKIFERLNLGALAGMLLYGTSPDEHNTTAISYDQQLKQADAELTKQIDGILNSHGSEEIQEAVFHHQATVSLVYFELGMKAGVALYRQLQEGLSELSLQGMKK